MTPASPDSTATRPQRGTEIKAITYSAMQVVQKEGDCEVFVIVDI